METKDRPEATPPGGGRQDHYAMRAGSMRAGGGPASTDTEAPVPEPIPGEHDATTLTHRQPGAMAGQFGGADTPAPDTGQWMDRDTARLHRQEGGGGSGKD